MPSNDFAPRRLGLAWTIPPPKFPPTTYTPVQKRGLRYQARVGVWLADEAATLGLTLHSGPWLPGPCQPDFLLESPSRCLLLIEVKLSQVECHRQFDQYRQILGPIPCIQICRRLQSPPTMQTLLDAHHGGTMMKFL